MQVQNEVRKITRGFQITIPQDFRKQNNIKEGDFIEVSLQGNKMIIEPISIKKKNPLDNLKSLFQSQPKDKFFDTKSEEEIMDTVNSEIKSSRKES
jgi:AbrB family looped-hinge helix DNA binding protein